MSASAGPLRVAIVVASLRILGGQAVQAQRMIDGWAGDSDVQAWIVPINPVPPAPFDRLLKVKYLRTVGDTVVLLAAPAPGAAPR